MDTKIAKLELEMHKGHGLLHRDVNELSRTVGAVVNRVVLLEEGQRETRAILAIHEEQRKIMHDKLDGKLDSLINSVQNLSTTTDANTNFIDKMKKYWIRTSLIFSGITLTLFTVYQIYLFLEKNGMVIVFEKVTQ